MSIWDEDSGHQRLGRKGFIRDRAELDLAYEEWRKRQIPVAKCNSQSFITFLVGEGLLKDEDIRAWVRDRELSG